MYFERRPSNRRDVKVIIKGRRESRAGNNPAPLLPIPESRALPPVVPAQPTFQQPYDPAYAPPPMQPYDAAYALPMSPYDEAYEPPMPPYDPAYEPPPITPYDSAYVPPPMPPRNNSDPVVGLVAWPAAKGLPATLTRPYRRTSTKRTLTSRPLCGRGKTPPVHNILLVMP